MNRYIRVLFLVVAVLGSIYSWQLLRSPEPEVENVLISQAKNDPFDRNPKNLILSKHAKCRMDCRQIDETEIREILTKGKINWKKSEPNNKPDPKYAVEGITHDNQKVRIVVADSKKGLVVVTVIDLETEWACACS